MIYRLLGELVVGREDQPLDLPGGVTLALLAALLVYANRPLSQADLIRVAWQGEEAKTAQLHKRVSELRTLLAAIGHRDDIRTLHGFGYELRVDVGQVDALEFQRLVRDAAEADADHRVDDEIGLLRQALRLWRGQHPLSNVLTEMLSQDIDSLEQRRRSAAARLFGLEIGRGDHESVLDELILMVGYYPADRRLCEQLILAQYRCGHIGDVASTYQRHHDALAEQFGSQPDPLLRTFHFAIARNDAPAMAPAESAIARRATIQAPPAFSVPKQLPRPVDLVGRGDLAAEVSWLLRRNQADAVPVVVISGSGGIGKTALALHAAHRASDRYPDGQLYVEMRGTVGGGPDTGEIMAQLLRAFGVRRIPETKDERLAAYRSLLASRQVLIVLDDVADESQVTDLVPANPRCAVLVTARQRLPEIGGAHHLPPLEPLAAAQATELFLRVVEDTGISLQGELDAVSRVVVLCGGLPLALRIAGALRVHDHPRPTAELADRLAKQGPEALIYRELSVARTIGAGFERLDVAGRQLFLAFGLLPLTSFGLWTAAALLDGPQAGSAALSQLAASFMIESMTAEVRYRLHDLMTEYARRRGQVEYPGNVDQVPAVVYRALLTLVRRAHAALYGGSFEVVHSQVPDWDAPQDILAEVDAAPLDLLDKERWNIRAAIEDCAERDLTDICWDLAVSAHEFYGIRGYYDDWLATHTVALEACRRAGDRRGEGILLACLNQPALVASRRTGAGQGIAEVNRAVELLAATGDRHGQAIALRTLANSLRRQGHLNRPLVLFGEALAHYEASGDIVGQWQALRFIGQTHLVLGHHDQAHTALRQAMAIASELGDERLIAQTQYWICQACLATGDLEAAQVAADALLETYRDQAGVGRAYALHAQGDLAMSVGDFAAAEQHLVEAVSLASTAADAFLEGRAWLSQAGMYQACGQAEAQIDALARAAAVFAECGVAYLEASALAALASARLTTGDGAAADAAWAQIEQIYDAADLPAEDRIHRRPPPEAV